MVVIDPLSLFMGFSIGFAGGTALVRHINRNRPSELKTIADNISMLLLIRATEDVCDDDTNKEIEARANELAEEYDLPVPYKGLEYEFQ